jgi:hypothetical protein
MGTNAKTASEITSEVEVLLGSRRGQEKIEQLNAHFERVARESGDMKGQVARLGDRMDIRFYASIGKLQLTPLKIDVRIAGRSCGEITLRPGRPERWFIPRTPNSLCPKAGLDWGKPQVGKYLAERRESIEKEMQTHWREAVVESALIVGMAERASRDKLGPLLRQQPVQLLGLPFQFPVPVVARARERAVAQGNRAGHIDLVARSARRGQLVRVFEVKQPHASDVGHALEQAVVYCAQLTYLVRRFPSLYYGALGYRAPRRTWRVDAVAFVHDTPRVRRSVEASAGRLLHGGSPFGLYAQFYRWDHSTARPRLRIADEQLYATATPHTRSD